MTNHRDERDRDGHGAPATLRAELLRTAGGYQGRAAAPDAGGEPQGVATGAPHDPSFMVGARDHEAAAPTDHGPAGVDSTAGSQGGKDAEAIIAARHRAYLARRLREGARREKVRVEPMSARLDEAINAAGVGGQASTRRRPAPSGNASTRRHGAGLGQTLVYASIMTMAIGAGVGFYLAASSGDSGLPIGERVHQALTSGWSSAASSGDRSPAPRQGQKARLSVASPATAVGSGSRSTGTAVKTPAPPQASAPGPTATAATPAAGEQSQAPAPAAEAVSSKPVKIATLKVANATGRAASRIPMVVGADASLDGRAITLKVDGVPTGARLTRGQRQGDGSWLVDPAEAAGLALIVPEMPPSALRLTVAAIERDSGDLAAPVKEMRVNVVAKDVVVTPASQPVVNSRNFSGQTVAAEPRPRAVDPDEALPEPPSSDDDIAAAAAEPAPQPGPNQRVASLPPEPENPTVKQAAPASPQSRALITRGIGLLRFGDVVAARRLFEKAVEYGDANAAIMVGRTYDPVVFEKLDVRGLKADPQRAMSWYQRARAAGARADAEITALNTWLNR